MEAITEFLNEKYRPQSCCCCFSLKAGTYIIGILDICYNIAQLILNHGTCAQDKCQQDICRVDKCPPDICSEDKEYSTVTFLRGKSDVTVVIRSMFQIILLIAAAAMVLGNFRGNKRLMLPFVYIKFIELLEIMIVDMVMLPLALFFLAKFSDGLIALLAAIIAIVVGTYIWQIVQCRILELEETTRPETLFTHGDPEIPAYSNVRDTSVQSAGITSSIDVGSQILH